MRNSTTILVFLLILLISSACDNSEIEMVSDKREFKELRHQYEQAFNASEIKLYFGEVSDPVYRSFTIEFVFKSQTVVKLLDEKISKKIARSFFEKLSPEEIGRIDYIDIYFSTWKEHVIWDQGHVEIEQFSINDF